MLHDVAVGAPAFLTKNGRGRYAIVDMRDYEKTQAAIAMVSKITKAIRMLYDHALLGAPLSTVAEVESDYRFLVSGNYMVLYRANGNKIYIDRVLYGRRDYMRVLFEDQICEERTNHLST